MLELPKVEMGALLRRGGPNAGSAIGQMRALNRHTLLAYDWLMSSQTIESEAIGEWGEKF
jgi:hypothetical protein